MQTVTVTLLESLSQPAPCGLSADTAKPRAAPPRRHSPPPASSGTVPQPSITAAEAEWWCVRYPWQVSPCTASCGSGEWGCSVRLGWPKSRAVPERGRLVRGGAHNPGGSRASGWRWLVNLGIFVPREGCLPATTTPLKGTALASDWCTNNKVRGLRPRSGRSPALGSARAPRGRTGLRFEALPAGGDGVHAGARGTAAKPWLG